MSRDTQAPHAKTRKAKRGDERRVFDLGYSAHVGQAVGDVDAVDSLVVRCNAAVVPAHNVTKRVRDQRMTA